MATDYEFLFKNVDLIDGTGGTRRHADVAISGGQIASIGDIPDEASEAVLDVSGKVLAPGFIDPHGHSDLTLLSQPTGLSKIMQGVTTEIIGNCGMAPAPVTELNRSELDGDGMFMRGGEDVELSWESMGDYLARLGDGGLGFNVLPLVGHCQIRSGAMGFEDRTPTAPELQRMCDLLREALGAGALGMSTGLIFPPSSYADTEELVELAKVLADHGAMYFSHIRGEDHRLSAAVTEAVEIGERSGAPVQIAHFKAFDLDLAIIEIDALIADNPTDPYFRELKGQILFENGRLLEAWPHYEAANQLLPDDPLLMLELARLEIEIGTPEYVSRSVKTLEQVVRSEEDNNIAWWLLSIGYGREGHMAESALASGEQALLEGRPKDAQLHAERALRSASEGSPIWLRAQDIHELASRQETAE